MKQNKYNNTICGVLSILSKLISPINTSQWRGVTHGYLRI